jgi:hypothetical protein
MEMVAVELQDEFFETKDRARIHLSYFIQKNSKATLVFWPANLTSAQAKFYSPPLEQIIKQNLSIVFYNPRGHGPSSGSFASRQAAEDLFLWLKLKSLKKNLIAVGHSGGALGLLLMTQKELDWKFHFLAAPILDSCESLQYMYDQNRIEGFLSLLHDAHRENLPHEAALKKPNWWKPEEWKKQDFSKRWDYAIENAKGIKIESLSKTLEGIFVDHPIVKTQLRQHPTRTKVFLPTKDDWYPKEVTTLECQKAGIPILEISKARDHFFMGAWSEIWNEVLKSIPT